MNEQTQFQFSTLPAQDLYLARYSECSFWISRYMERIENIARVLDVTHTFSPASLNEQNWESVLALNSDEETFAERYETLTAENVIRFYLTDASHPGSILSCMHAARINASQIRPVISTEMWIQINTMYNTIRTRIKKDVAPEELWFILADIRNQCMMFAGCAESGLYRDQGWYFYMLGKYIERADQTTRLLDIKYHLLLPSPDAVGSTIDASQWFSLLRAASGYHAFRREYPYVISPTTVAGFLLLDRRFPRSVTACLATVSHALKKLQSQFNLVQTRDISALNEVLRTKLKSDSIEKIISGGMHEYLDKVQLHLTKLSNHIASHYF
jgi:uncharacterized alpha-E superfamily protein